MSERREQPQPPTPGNPAVVYRELRDDLWQEALEGAKRVKIAKEWAA